MQDTLYVSSRGELAVYKSGDKKILNEKPTYYTTLGNNTDGAMTQKAVTDALSALSEEVKNKLAEFKNDVVDKVMPEVNDKVSGMERFVTTKIEDMKRETSTLVNTTTNDVNLMNNKLNKHIEQADIVKNDLLDKIRRNTDSISDTNNNTSSLDAKFTKLTSDNKAEAAQIKANLATTNSVLSTHKELVDKKFTDVNTEQTSQNSLISDILNAFSKESEKGTSLKLNSSATKVLGMTIYGNTEQVNTSGKNLLKITARTASSQGVSSTASDDGTISYSGTMTGLWANITDYTVFSTPLPAGKYTFSIDHSHTHRIILKYKLADNTFSETIANLTATSTSNTFTVTQPIIAGYLFIAAANGSNLNDTVKAQLEYGDTATDYEPYTDGPNNLFDEFSNLPYSRDGITLSNQNGVLKLAGQPTVDWIPLTSRNITSFLQDKQTYTVFQPNIYGVKLYPEVIAQRKDGGKSMSWNGQNAKTFTFTVDFDTYSSYSMKLQIGPKSAYPEPITFYNNYALFVGSYTLETIPEYSPYNTPLVSPRPQLPQVVKELNGSNVSVISKNLLNIRNNNGGLYSLKTTVNPDSSITIQGKNKNFWGMNFTDDGACPRIEQGTKVTMSIDRPLPYKLVLSCWTSTGGPSSQFPLVTINAGSTSATNVAAHTALSGHLYVSISEIDKQINETFKVQLEYGDTATDFVPHESSELTIPNNLNIYKLTDAIYDEIRLENGVAKLIKRVGKLELSGEEYFRTINAENPGQFYVYSNVFDTLMKNSTAGMCTHFDIASNTVLAGVKTNKTVLSVFSDNGNDLIRIMFSAPDALNLKITDINSFKNWLKAEKAKGTPVTVYYEMKTPTEEQITDQAILTQLNKLMETRTYDGITNISVTGEGLTPEIKVKYMRKIGE